MTSRAALRSILPALLAGLALRAWEAAESSLWLDELHTLAHAAQPDLRSVLTSVSQEVHTPLFFACVHLFGAWPEGAWLRIIPVLSSLLLFAPVWQLARDAAGARAAGLALLLLALLPYQVHWAAELRPYFDEEGKSFCRSDDPHTYYLSWPIADEKDGVFFHPGHPLAEELIARAKHALLEPREIALEYRVPPQAALVPFLLEDFAEKPQFFQPDRIHPTEAAQPLMLERVWPALKPLLK